MTRPKKVIERPSLLTEHDLWARGIERVAGVDEAGRGPLAGPVVTAAVVLDPQFIPFGINDSKKLSETARENLFDKIAASAEISIASSSAETIDRLNIRGATLKAMARAVAGLSDPADHALIDGRDVPAHLAGRATALIRGDARSLSIAAASICAKVIRDRMMEKLDGEYPGYGFAQHKGYGTEAHRAAIARLGPSPVHRRSFAPIKEIRK